MFEMMLCSLLTILPDYLFRRYVQGKRIGREITFYSVWFELRWGITSCLILTVLLITTIFYNHPSTSSVTMYFRTVPILPEINGRVAQIYIGITGPIKKGEPIFRLDSSKQEAAVEAAKRKIAEVDAAMAVARSELAKAESQVAEAKSEYLAARLTSDLAKDLYERDQVLWDKRVTSEQLLLRSRSAAAPCCARLRRRVPRRPAAVPSRRRIPKASPANARAPAIQTPGPQACGSSIRSPDSRPPWPSGPPAPDSPAARPCVIRK